QNREILDTLDVARILMPGAASHSLPVLAAELSLDQPRPHRALDDADATRQLLVRLRDLAAGLDERLKEWIVSLVAPYGWALTSSCTEPFTPQHPPPRRPRPGPPAEPNGGPRERGLSDGPPEDPSAVAALLGPDGVLASALPDYELREAQLQMVLAVAQIL